MMLLMRFGYGRVEALCLVEFLLLLDSVGSVLITGSTRSMKSYVI